MIIRRETLKAALAVAGEPSKGLYHLHAVQVHPDGSVQATDGSIGVSCKEKSRFPDNEFPSANLPPYKGDPAEAVLLPGEVVDGLLKAMPKRSPIPILQAVQLSTNGDDGGIVVSATDLQAPRVAHVSKEETQASYPVLSRVMVRADRPALQLTLSAAVLRQLATLAETVMAPTKKGQRLRTVTFYVQTEPQHQGRTIGEPKDCTFRRTTPEVDACQWCGEPEAVHQGGKPNGVIIDQVRVVIEGDDVMVEGVVMPCLK